MDRLNILVVSSYFYPEGGGAENYAFNIARRLVKKGHKVTVLCSTHQGRNQEEIIDGVENRGASDNWTKDGANAYLDQIVKSRFVYFSGYSLMNNSDTILYLMGKCRRNCEVWFNPGAPNIIDDSYVKIVRDFVDVLILNLDEARSMTKKSEIKEIVAELGKMVGLSAITLGKEGCVVSTGKEWIQVPQSHSMENVDTTGAGDAFSAGFMVGRLRGMDETECARFGHDVAASFLKEKTVMK